MRGVFPNTGDGGARWKISKTPLKGTNLIHFH